MKTYFQHINEGIRTTVAGMKLTLRHLWAARTRRSNNNIRENDYFNEQSGMVTLQYPFETMPIPDNGRYRLHNEMDDCIVCDKCAKVCPVDCIDIEPIKATSEVGKASDGSPIRLYAAKFDIDMAKCCYCGLCTTVCPTECLTMTKTFDYSEFDVRDMNYHYANLSPEQAAEKKSLYEQFLKEKEELKKQGAVHSPQSTVGDISTHTPEPTEAKPKPAFKPTIKPSIPKTEEIQSVESKEPKPKPVFAPKKPVTESQTSATEPETSNEKSAKPKPVFAPKKPATESQSPTIEQTASSENVAKPKPVFKPTKPKTVTEEQSIPVQPSLRESEGATKIDAEPAARPKPIFKPTMKPVSVEKVEAIPETPEVEPEPAARPKPIFKPTMKPVSVEKVEAIPETPEVEPEPAARPKPIFKPTMKPKVVEGKIEDVSKVPDSQSDSILPKENTDSVEVKPQPKPVFKPTMRPKKEE